MGVQRRASRLDRAEGYGLPMRPLVAMLSLLAVLCLSLVALAWTNSAIPKVVAMVAVVVLVLDRYVPVLRRSRKRRHR